jgi:hypothetical protein
MPATTTLRGTFILMGSGVAVGTAPTPEAGFQQPIASLPQPRPIAVSGP